jgi:hypothetical protein
MGDWSHKMPPSRTLARWHSQHGELPSCTIDWKLTLNSRPDTAAVHLAKRGDLRRERLFDGNELMTNQSDNALKKYHLEPQREFAVPVNVHVASKVHVIRRVRNVQTYI